MRLFGKFAFRAFVFCAVLVFALWMFGPREEVDLDVRFDASELDAGVDAYLAAREAAVEGITPGVQKQVIWAGETEAQTAWSVLYIHGFSATAQEVRPLPDEVADALGANLVFTRLAGHGVPGDALGEVAAGDWMNDVAEALAVARKTGERVLVITTSTGGTLAAAAASNPELMSRVAGIVMISPNFAINDPLAPLLTWPAARTWLPVLAGEQRSWEPKNEAQGRYWTTSYPSVAGLQVGALVAAVEALDLGQADVPAFFIFSDDDQVVRPDATRAAAAEWGGPFEIFNPVLTDRDDPSAHVIAGDILSPDQTAPIGQAIIDWARGLN